MVNLRTRVQLVPTARPTPPPPSAAARPASPPPPLKRSLDDKQRVTAGRVLKGKHRLSATQAEEEAETEVDARPPSPGPCAWGCQRTIGHVGLCLTDAGLQPPDIKVQHAAAKRLKLASKAASSAQPIVLWPDEAADVGA